MDKRLFQALAFSFLFLLAWSAIMGKFFPMKATPVQQATMETGKDVSPLSTAAIPETSAVPEQESEDLPTATIGEFDVTFSPKGGYIKELRIIGDEEPLPFRNLGYTLDTNDTVFVPHVTESGLLFTTVTGQRKEFIFEGFLLHLRQAATEDPITLFSNTLVKQRLYQRYQTVFYSQDDQILRKHIKKLKAGTYDGVAFMGARERYYCAALLPGKYDALWRKDAAGGTLLLVSTPPEITLYVGPQKMDELEAVGLQAVIYYGWFHFIGIGMMKLLHFFFSLTHNWGVSIILLSAIVYGVLFPFTMKSTKAMKRMQEVQPEIEALKKQHKDNPQKLNKETLELYRKYKINPLGGCLPLFFQLPVFISLYQVLLRLVELKGAHFLWIKDLSLPDHAFMLPTALPLVGQYINVIPLLMMAVGLVQQKITVGQASSSEQKNMGLFFSVFLGVIFYKFPSCLVLYWFCQNLLTFSYQLKLHRSRVTA